MDLQKARKLHKKQNIVFLVNPVAGISSNKFSALERAISSSLNLTKFNYKIVVGDSAAMLALEARKAVDNKTDIVAAVGGDGTINLVSKELKNSNTSLAIIPDGSGNGLARHIGIPMRISSAIKVINEQNKTTIDTVDINGHYYVSIAGIGFDARVAKLYAKSKMRGLLPYVRIMLEEYPGYKPKSYTIVVDGKRLKVRALFIAFANSGQFGYNTLISPTAELSDGLIDVIIFRKVPVLRLPQLLAVLFRKKIDQSGYATILKGRNIRVLKRKNKLVNIDGEAVVMESKLNISIHPSSLKVVVP